MDFVSGQLFDQTGTPRTVNKSFINATGSGNTEVVAAQGSGIKIRVLSMSIVAALATTVKLQSATNNISSNFALANNGGVLLSYNPHGWFETNANEALNINLSLGVNVGTTVVWIQTT